MRWKGKQSALHPSSPAPPMEDEPLPHLHQQKEIGDLGGEPFGFDWFLAWESNAFVLWGAESTQCF